MLQAWSLLIFEGAVSHNVLYYQRLSIARYHNANNYFEQLPIVSRVPLNILKISRYSQNYVSVLILIESKRTNWEKKKGGVFYSAV